VLRVRGELDLASAGQFAAALEKAASANPRLVVDLAGLTFVDVCGLRVILQAAESRNGLGPLPLVNAARIAWLLELVGLDGIRSIEFRDGR
jgi:anti-anti-sigma factor